MTDDNFNEESEAYESSQDESDLDFNLFDFDYEKYNEAKEKLDFDLDEADFDFDFNIIGEYLEFDPTFMSKDEILAILALEIAEEDSRPHIINKQRVDEFNLARSILGNLCRGTDVRITSVQNEKFIRSCGCISLIGDSLEFANINLFISACNLASNIEVYIRKDGKVRMNLTFHRMTIPKKETGDDVDE